MNLNQFRTIAFAAAWAAVALFEAGAAQAAGEWPPAPLLARTPDVDPGPLPASVTAEALSDGRWRVEFRFRPEAPVEGVSLAGTFNGWRPTATPMSDADGDGVWTAAVELPAGRQLYKFVLAGGKWVADPQNPESEDDGHSGRNSILRLGYVAQLRSSTARVGDGQIESRAVLHDPRQAQYFQWVSDDELLVRLRTLAHDVQQVRVVVREGPASTLRVVDTEEPLALWEAVVRIPGRLRADHERLEYTFVMRDGTSTFSGPSTYEVRMADQDAPKTPEWARDAVWYQIMVDRFRNGDPSNDREPVRKWTSEWFTPSSWEKDREKNGESFYDWYVYDRQYGGDLQGLMQELPYLKDLGVNAIYLMPMFKAESNHKYNTESYLHVDDHFGFKGDYDAVKDQEDHTDPSTWQWTKTDKLFLEFLRKAHEMGFKVIIDGVFNHVGTAHPAFQDVKKNGKDSRYADWFDVTSWDPFKYEGWFGIDSLPVFKKDADGYASDAVKEYIFNVTRRWMDPNGDGDPSDGIDGWRLDVPNEVPKPFWVQWRKLVKSINPDAYISGEIWDRADEWLDGTTFDAVMNYEFASAVVAWAFNEKQKIGPSEFDQRLRELRMAYPLAVTLVLQNLMDSHDTDRVASMAFNPDRQYDKGNRPQDGAEYNNDKPSPGAYGKVRVAALIQMTYVGAPMIWYGDEAGMWGADDPTCRKPMLWKDLEPYDKPEDNYVMEEQLEFYRRAIALRRAHPALRTGGFQTLLADDGSDVWAFLRANDDEQLVVVLNASDADAKVRIPLPDGAPGKWHTVFRLDSNPPPQVEGLPDVDVSDGKLPVTVPALGGLVLHAPTPK